MDIIIMFRHLFFIISIQIDLSVGNIVFHPNYSLLPVNRPGGKKSDRRRFVHFMERVIVRVNVATPNRVAVLVSRTTTHRPLHRRVSSIRPSATPAAISAAL